MSEHKHTKEEWIVDTHGFNVVSKSGTVAILQPHARIKSRAKLIAAAPAMGDILETLSNWNETSKADNAAQICNELHPIIVMAQSLLKEINGG